MPRTIAVGISHDPGRGRVDLVLLPGETPPDARPGLTVHAARNLPDALYMLRIAFAAHSEIATLGAATVVGSDPIWTPAVETRLIEFLEDLGNCPLDSWQGALNMIAHGARLANPMTSDGLRNALAGKPAIVIGAGPSATPAALAHIAKLQGNHYVFACDAMMHACRYSSIIPHFVTMLERVPEMLPLVRCADKASMLIATTVIDPRCADEFTNVLWIWGGDDIYNWLAPGLHVSDIGRSSGTLAIGAAIAAGCNPIYLVGHDLAYGADSSHSTSAHADATDGQRNKDANAVPGLYELTYTEVPGWDGTPVRTNGAWQLMRADIQAMAAGRGDLTLISAQNGAGAAISGVLPGFLPDYGPLERVPQTPEIPRSDVQNPLERIPGILADAANCARVADAVLWTLERGSTDTGLDKLAAALATSAMVSPDNRMLFRYVFRTIHNNLFFRLNMLAAEHPNPPRLQRECLAIQARSILSMSHRMITDLEALSACPATP